MVPSARIFWLVGALPLGLWLAGCERATEPTRGAPAVAPPSPAAMRTSDSRVNLFWKPSHVAGGAPELVLYDRAPELGVNAHGASQFQHVAALNVRTIRHTLYWTPGNPDGENRQLDEAIAAARAIGAQLLLVVHSPNVCWQDFDSRAAAHQAYANTLERLALRDAADGVIDVRFWELFNEQDADGWTNLFGARPSVNAKGDSAATEAACSYSAPTVSPIEQGKLYAGMLKLAYPKIRAASANRSFVVTGGLVYVDTIVPGGNHFLEGVYAGGGAGYFDIVGIHTYHPDGYSTAYKGGKVEGYLAAKGETNRLIFNTEFGTDWATYVNAYGVPASNLTATFDANQRDWLNAVLDAARNTSVYNKLFVYAICAGGGTARDTAAKTLVQQRLAAEGRTLGDVGFGLLRSGCNPWDARPSYASGIVRGFNAFPAPYTVSSVEVYSPGRVPVGYSYTVLPGNWVRIAGVVVDRRFPTRLAFKDSSTFVPSTIGQLGVQYRVHMATFGWTDWAYDSVASGTTGQARATDLVEVKLAPTSPWSVRYRVYSKDRGWGDWVSDGATAGVYGAQMVGFEAYVVDPATEVKAPQGWNVCYYAHVEAYGWLSAYPRCNSSVDGLEHYTGWSLVEQRRIEALRIWTTRTPPAQ